MDKIFTLEEFDKKAWEKLDAFKYVCMQKAYGLVKRETLWQILMKQDLGDKLLNGIKNMYVNS